MRSLTERKATLEQEQELIRRMHSLLRWVWQVDKDTQILCFALPLRKKINELLTELGG